MLIGAMAAGLMISFGACLYLKIGGIIGAIMFSVGLLTILRFQFFLFTGKAGLYYSKQISLFDLWCIWIFNFSGCVLGALIIYGSGISPSIQEAAADIISKRVGNTSLQNICLGVICGILMYIAVQYFVSAPWITTMCVAAFILLGTNHCVADMAYMSIACQGNAAEQMIALGCTTVGNFVGCNLIPFVKVLMEKETL